MAPETSGTLADRRTVALDPWTVYGQVVGPTTDGDLSVDVADIGVLPPPGDYRGTTGTRAVRSAVRLRVGTAGSGSLERHREVTVEAQDLDNLVPGTMVAITFEALAL